MKPTDEEQYRRFVDGLNHITDRDIEENERARKNRTPNQQEVEKLARQIWRDREITFPTRVRRMQPDAMDYVTGAWDRVIREARTRLQAE